MKGMNLNIYNKFNLSYQINRRFSSLSEERLVLICTIFSRYILDNWEKRHGLWKLHKHRIPDISTSCSSVQGSVSTGNSNPYNVVIKFMHDTLELNLTLGHQITADTLPSIEISEEVIPANIKDEAPIKRKIQTVTKVLHWTLLKIEFTNPSKLMLRQRKNLKTSADGEDVKLAHYLVLRSLTPSCLAEQCPNTKLLEKTLSVISQVSTYILLKNFVAADVRD